MSAPAEDFSQKQKKSAQKISRQVNKLTSQANVNHSVNIEVQTESDHTQWKEYRERQSRVAVGSQTLKRVVSKGAQNNSNVTADSAQTSEYIRLKTLKLMEFKETQTDDGEGDEVNLTTTPMRQLYS